MIKRITISKKGAYSGALSMNIIIRKAEKTDYVAVRNIMDQVQQMHVEWRPDVYRLNDDLISEERFDFMLDAGDLYVADAEGKAVGNATKIWITSSGKALLCNNNSRIPERILSKMLRVVEANSADFTKAWKDHFGEISYYC